MKIDKKRLLIVDDEAGLTRLIKWNLERLGRFVVEIVNESPKVFSAVKLNKPDLILLDMEMPEMDGEEVLRLLGRDPLLENIPIVIFSAHEERNRTGIPMIPKPVSLNRLINTIDTLLIN